MMENEGRKRKRKRKVKKTRMLRGERCRRDSTANPEASNKDEHGNGSFERRHADDIVQLANMGFDTESCILALRNAGGDPQMAVQLLISGNSTKGGASYAAPRTNAKGRGKIAGRLLAAVPQDTRPDAAPVDFSVPAISRRRRWR